VRKCRQKGNGLLADSESYHLVGLGCFLCADFKLTRLPLRVTSSNYQSVCLGIVSMYVDDGGLHCFVCRNKASAKHLP
jgi:hypothetical protein